MRSESLQSSAELRTGADLGSEPDADLRVLRDESASRPTVTTVSAVPASPAAASPASAGAAPRRGRAARFFGELPLAVVIAGAGVGLVIIALHHFRWGNLAISAAVLAGAIFRLVLPTRRAGLLAVRSRFTDVVTMGALGGALMVLAAVTST